MFSVGEIAYWLICLAVVLLMGALIYVAWWALFADRPRGRRRCPRCWYDMAHAPPPGMTCAECGFAARKERQFHGTHRRYGIAAAAIIVNVAIALFITERSMQRGFTALLPTRVLIWLMPIAGDPNGGLRNELAFRASRAMLTDGQWRSLMNKCASGDWRARPIDDAWKKKYGECIVLYRAMLIGKPEIEAPLRSIPPEIQVTSRDRWPEGVPMTVAVQVLDWWPVGTECRVRVAPHMEGVEPVTAYRAVNDRWPRSPLAVHLPPLDPATTEIVLDVHVDRRPVTLTDDGLSVDSSDPAEWEPVFDKTFRLAVKSQGSLAQAAQSVSSTAMGKAIEGVFDIGVVKWEQGRSPVRFNIGAPETFTGLFANTAVGLRVELLREGTVARRLNVWWLGGVGNAGNDLAGRNYGFEIDFEDPALLRQLQSGEELRHWQMRVVGDPLIALRAGKAPKYWAGEVVFPVRAMVRPGTSPPQVWQREE